MAAPAKFLFDMDFSAPDKTRERPAHAGRKSHRKSHPPRAAPIATVTTRAARAKAENDRRTALALEEIGLAIQASRHGFPALKPDGDRSG